MSMDTKWEQVVRTAVEKEVARLKTPVSGARLKQAIDATANEFGLKYPPPEFLDKKFADFLKYFENIGILALRPRVGQDILAAPIDQVALLTKTSLTGGRKGVGIRKDLFDAFTVISVNIALYNRDLDKVVWKERDQLGDFDGYIEIPGATLEQELKDRREFIGTIADVANQDMLKDSLSKLKPLAAFTAVIKSLGHQPKWHSFRTECVAGRIEKWATNSGIAWKSGWLTSSLAGEVFEQNSPLLHIDVQREWRRSLSLLIESLDEADLCRISIPLDIVAKALQQKR